MFTLLHLCDAVLHATFRATMIWGVCILLIVTKLIHILVSVRVIEGYHLTEGRLIAPANQLITILLAALAQMVACLPLVQRVWGSISSGVVNFHLKIFNLGARRGGDVHFLIARLYITGLD